MTKKCWYCHKDTMEPRDFKDGHKGHKCSVCGATDVQTPRGHGTGSPVAPLTAKNRMYHTRRGA